MSKSDADFSYTHIGEVRKRVGKPGEQLVCRNGHIQTDDGIWRGHTDGYLRCRECRRRANREYDRRRRA